MYTAQIVTGNEIPLSGEYDEVNFGGGNDLIRVKFESDLDIWYGKFDRGNLKNIVTYGYDDTCMVIIGNSISVINPFSKKIIKQNDFENIDTTGSGMIETCYFWEQNAILCVSNYEGIQFYDQQLELVYETASGSCDGYGFIGVKGELLWGCCTTYYGEQIEFYFDFFKKQFMNGSGVSNSLNDLVTNSLVSLEKMQKDSGIEQSSRRWYFVYMILMVILYILYFFDFLLAN